MSTRPSRAVMALVAVLIAATGCASKPPPTPQQQLQTDIAAFEAQVRKIVSDPARADRLVALSNEFYELDSQRTAIVEGYRAKLTTLNSNYQATRQDFEALFAEQDALREPYLRKALALRTQMAALTTDAQWEELNKARLRVLEVRP